MHGEIVEADAAFKDINADEFDGIIIGGGILGCFTARNLRRWNISVLLLEKEDDVCKGITRANSAIVYAGYDNKPGSLKAQMTVRGNAGMEALCRDLEVPFSRCGSLLVTYDEGSVPKLLRKLDNAKENGVPGVKLLRGEEAEAMEPMLRKGVAAALYAPSTGTVNPWQLGIAAYENALQNGAEAKLNTEDIPNLIQLTGKEFGITEDERGGVLQHLIEGKDLSLYGLSNAVTRYAQDVESYDRSTELEGVGYKILTMHPRIWKHINQAAA